MTVCICGQQWSPLAELEIARFHTDAYIHFLKQLEHNGREVVDDAPNYVLNNSVCFSETAWLFSQIYAGGSVAAATSLVQGIADVAINWVGGQTHARRDCASGFSYVNDAVLAILTLLQTYERVLFVSCDACHSSGVEEAFYTTDRVMCISLHRRHQGSTAGSGSIKDTGELAGKHHTVNLPIQDGFNDEDLETLFVPVVNAAADRFQPHAVVCSAGTSMLAGDRLGCMNLSLAGYKRCIQVMLALGRPLLLLGGTGFTQPNAARAWCCATATVCGVDIATALPEHECYSYYAPTFRLDVPPAILDDLNTPEKLAHTRASAMQTILQTTQHAGPPKLAAAPPSVLPAADASPVSGQEDNSETVLSATVDEAPAASMDASIDGISSSPSALAHASDGDGLTPKLSNLPPPSSFDAFENGNEAPLAVKSGDADEPMDVETGQIDTQSPL